MKNFSLIILVAIFLGGCAAARPPILFPEFSGQGFGSEAECLSVCADFERRDAIGNTVYGTGAGASIGAAVALLTGLHNPWAVAAGGAVVGGVLGVVTAPSQRCFEKCRCDTPHSERRRLEVQDAERRVLEDARRDFFREENLQE